MSAAKTGFPAFVGKGETMYAAKITDMVTDQATGYTRISFGELDKQTVATSEWVRVHQPEIGGYMVVTNKGMQTYGRFMPAPEFFASYTSATEAEAKQAEAEAKALGAKVG